MFKKTHFGLDISDESLKFVELIATRSGVQLGRYGKQKIPAGIIESGKIKEAKKFKEIILSLKKEEGLKSFSAFEPEAQALTRAVIKKGDPETYMIINIGDEHTSISIISNTTVMFYSIIDENEKMLVDKIAKHFLYWHTHKDEQGKNRPSIAKVILCGENSNLSRLVEYLSIKLRHPVELAKVWINILDTEKNIPEMNFTESLSFATALGLALEKFK